MSELEKSSGSLSDSDSSEGSSLFCDCLDDPHYDFGKTTHTIGRFYRTVSTLANGAALSGVENDDHWILVPEVGSPGTTIGSLYFNVCSVTEITLRLYFAPSDAENYATIAVNGSNITNITIPPGTGEFHDYVLTLAGCVNLIFISGETVGLTDEILLEVIEVL